MRFYWRVIWYSWGLGPIAGRDYCYVEGPLYVGFHVGPLLAVVEFR